MGLFKKIKKAVKKTASKSAKAASRSFMSGARQTFRKTVLAGVKTKGPSFKKIRRATGRVSYAVPGFGIARVAKKIKRAGRRPRR